MEERARRGLMFLMLSFAVLVGTGFVADVVRTEDAVNTEVWAQLENNAHVASAVVALQTQRAERPIDVVLVGDIMLDRGVEASVRNTMNGNLRTLFDPLRKTITDADIAFANLEGAVSDVGVDSGKAYSFRFNPVVARSLASAGFDVVSQANNHMLDWGRDALCDSTKRLFSAGVTPVGAGCDGAEANTPFIRTIRNTKIAFLAYTDFDTWAVATDEKPGLSRFDTEEIKKIIAHLKHDMGVDVIFVSLHWGEEYETRSHEKQQALGHALVHAGADVVVGHHPHVSQEIERYGNGWIIYSLGNFIFDQSFSKETMEGLLVHAYIKDKHVYNLEPIAVHISPQFVPSAP